MKTSRCSNPISLSLCLVCAIVLAGSLCLYCAPDNAPNPNLSSTTEARTPSSELAKKKCSRLGPKRGNSLGAKPSRPAPRNEARADDIISLREQLAHQEKLLGLQQEQIAKLIVALDELKKSLNRSIEVSTEPSVAPPHAQTAAPHVELAVVRTTETVANPPGAAPGVLDVPHQPGLANFQPDKPAAMASLAPAAGANPPRSSPQSSAQTPPDQTQPYTTRLESLSKQVEGISKGIGGFRFSGDFRVRADGIFRSANAVAGTQQDMRGRYRARLNFDKGIDPQLDVHFQLGSGNFENPLTDSTDFGGGAVKGPIFLSEAWLDYHPNSNLNFQVGKMPEVFQDFTRFMWSNNVRFNGSQESVGTSPGDNSLGITRIDFRAGQYVLTNPNIQVLPTARQCAAANPPVACIYLQAGYKPGENVRSADLFDEGVFVIGRIKPGWSQYLFSNFLLYRNANQIALGETNAGYPIIVNNELGVTVAGPLTGTGTATTLPGGGIYTAGHFQIGHLAYRVTKEGLRVHGEEFPIFLDLQASRNFGTSFLRNAWMVTFNAGQITKAGDVRFLYFYGVKDANSMVSAFADTQMGTNSGVNIRTHSFRFDVGLARFLQWQNILYIQDEISPNDPARHFYVPLPRGTATQFRVQSSLFANF